MSPVSTPVARFARPFALALALATVSAASSASAPRATRPPFLPLSLDGPGHRRFALLDAFHDAAIERPGPVRGYLDGPWGRWRRHPWWSLEVAGRAVPSLPIVRAQLDPAEFGWRRDPAELGGHRLELAAWTGGVQDSDESQSPSLRTPESFVQGAIPGGAGDPRTTGGEARWSLQGLLSAWPAPVPVPGLLEPVARLLETLGRPAAPPAARGRCWRAPVLLIRYGAESDRFPLVRCDGAVAAEALDRMTLMARPPDVPRPGTLLPDEPDPEAWAHGEWLPGVRPVHARLLWLLQAIADAFPRRAIYVYSGYRPKGAGKGHSRHGDARAMDISLHGIKNEDLFRFCRTLSDVGCGYYPNSKFVHVDVRKPGAGRAFWVDASSPGEPSRYVDAWPGVVDSGAFVWSGAYGSAAR